MLRQKLHFDRPARPDGVGLQHGVRDHVSFCYVCTNFDTEVASTLNMIREGLFLDTVQDAVMVATTMSEVAEAAKDGCCSCRIIRACGSVFAPEHFDSQSDREITITYRADTTLILEYERVATEGDDHDPSGSGHVSVELFTSPGKPCPWDTIGSEVAALDPQYQTWMVPGGGASELSLDPSADGCFERIKGWMARCEEDHPYCDQDYALPTRERIVAKVPPKRLIYVGDSDDEVHLQDTNGNGERYTALSYCWGSSVGTTLLQSNMKQMYSRMPHSKLLKTHQDAITITRKLGFKYLWADALCIVQDSASDKADEISNMASIYMGAYLSIAASASFDGAAGCFGARAPTLNLSLTEQDGQTSEVFARVQLSHIAFDWGAPDVFVLGARNLFRPSAEVMSRYPIFTRGWTFQERLLSPRIVHYTSEEIVWECLGGSFCECGSMDDFVGSRALRERRLAAGVPRDIELICGKYDRSRRLAKRLSILDHGSNIRHHLPPVLQNDYALLYAVLGFAPEQQEEGKEMHERWRDLVSQYSARNLTFATDALLALSGLAAVWATRQPGMQEYLAGLWRSDLSRGLLWKCIDQKLDRRPETYLAPTWSWASIRRTVDWVPPFASCIYRATILDVVCRTSAVNPFGQVIGGQLIVKGFLVEAQLKTDDHLYTTTHAFVRAGDKTSTFIADNMPEVQSLALTSVFCLWWNTDIVETKSGGGFERALVLRASKPYRCVPNTFTRIGLMEHFPVHEWQDQLQEREVHII